MKYLRKCKDCGYKATTTEELEIFCNSGKNDKRKYGKLNMCKPCRNIRTKLHYKNNKDKKLKNERDRHSINKHKSILFKGSKCCDCGIEYNIENMAIFDFHHINESEKEEAPATMMRKSWDVISSELEKCVLLCSNCHRLRHHKKAIHYLEFILKYEYGDKYEY